MFLTLITLTLATAVVYSLSGLIYDTMKWHPKGKHCYVTGGSSGLGLSLSLLLVKKGAHVSIVARNQERLDKALEQLEKARVSPDQIIKAYAFPVDNLKGTAASIEAACEPHGNRAPDAAFLCAGGSQPGYWVDQDEESIKRGMDAAYWVQAWSAFAMSKKMVQDEVKGKIVFVSSYLGLFSIIGYSTYAPGKFALRGLAESLQSELMLYGIDIHICFPGNIATPGFDEENKTKPAVTRKIEEAEASEGVHPDIVARGLYKGVVKGNFHITYDFQGNLFRASGRASSPGNNFFLDAIYALIGFIALPIWRMTVDKTVRASAKEHKEYLENKGFFKK